MKQKNRIWIYSLILMGIALMVTISCKKDDDNSDDAPTTVTDIDGNIYNTVTIGTQIWMKENLKVTKYRDGTAIPNEIVSSTWYDLTTGAYCDYENTPSNSATYGKLYNWYAATDSRNIAPVGWHVPTDAEWMTLQDFLEDNGYGYQGDKYKIAKSMAATSGWSNSSNPGNVGNDQASNNSSGFTALPGGDRGGLYAEFSAIGHAGCFWSSFSEYSSTYGWSVSSDDDNVYRANCPKDNGLSIRCVKD